MYKIEKINDENDMSWQYLIINSHQWTPFHRENCLQAVGCYGRRYIVRKKNRIIVGLLLVVNCDGELCLPSFAPYQGLLFSESGDIYRTQKEQLEAVTVLLEELDKEYSSVIFVNHFSVSDMRACLWHHYHEPEKGMYAVTPWYTAIKTLSSCKEEIENGLSKGRKLDYRYSIERYGLQCETSEDYSNFFDLYRMTFARQDIDLTEVEINTVERVIMATSGSIGLLRYAVDSDGNRIDAVYILVDGDTAYYLFGANHPEYRKCGGGTFLLVEVMKELGAKGIK